LLLAVTPSRTLLCLQELTRIALERCATARCAVQTMGNLSVTYGFFAAEMSPTDYSLAGAGECLLVSDANDIWQFHVIAGIKGTSAIWAAQRIPEDHVTVMPNRFGVGCNRFGCEVCRTRGLTAEL